jgi:hypothetical protein
LDIFLLEEAFVSIFDPAGAHRVSRSYGGPGNQGAAGVAADVGGPVVVVGAFENEIDFGDGPLISGGALDVFVAKLWF